MSWKFPSRTRRQRVPIATALRCRQCGQPLTHLHVQVVGPVTYSLRTDQTFRVERTPDLDDRAPIYVSGCCGMGLTREDQDRFNSLRRF